MHGFRLAFDPKIWQTVTLVSVLAQVITLLPTDLADGVTISPLTLNLSNQTRSDSKAGYIDPLPPRDNLVILTRYQVTGLTFNDTTDANGNVVASGIKFQAGTGQPEYTVTANREVILW